MMISGAETRLYAPKLLTETAFGAKQSFLPPFISPERSIYREQQLELPAVHWRGALPIPPKRELYPLRFGFVPDCVHFSQGHVGKETAFFYRMVLEIGKPAAELLTGSAQRNLRIDAI